jgi:predicted SPOUT superfamily RNA methylase MTH1
MDSPCEKTDRLSLSDVGSTNMSIEYLRANCSPRPYTVTVAIPVSIISQVQTREMKSFLIGQLARCLAVNKVDEVVVYADGVVDESTDNDYNPCLFLARLLQYAETPSYLRKALFPMHSDFRFAGLLTPMDSPHHMKRDDVRWAD